MIGRARSGWRSDARARPEPRKAIPTSTRASPWRCVPTESRARTGCRGERRREIPESASLYVLYLQLLKSEADSALQRGLAAFPDNAEVHVFVAQAFKGTGNEAAALSGTKRALAVNRLPHG
jgi:hypothetical protein